MVDGQLMTIDLKLGAYNFMPVRPFIAVSLSRD
jgi:hypothetical protein